MVVLSYPKIPVQLTTLKPKHRQYPQEIITLGDELRAERIKRGLSQFQVSKIMGVNKNFTYLCETKQKEHTIFMLHAVTKFLGYIPKTLKLDETTLRGKLFALRIRNGYTYKNIADMVGVNNSTLAHFEKGGKAKEKTIQKIQELFK